jgi:hypothetical protein
MRHALFGWDITTISEGLVQRINDIFERSRSHSNSSQWIRCLDVSDMNKSLISIPTPQAQTNLKDNWISYKV